MEIEYLLEQPREGILENSFYDFELPQFISKIKNDCAWKMGDLKSIIVLNSVNKKVVLTGLHAQTEIDSEQTGQWINIHVLEGDLKIKIKKISKVIGAGQKFTLFNKVKYKLEAVNECIFLLIIAPPKS